MQDLPLQFTDGHLFLRLATDLWLLDTGAPWSFGRSPDVTVAEERFPVGDDYLGLTAEQLSGFVGAECAGLLGGDVLGRFDWIFDVPAARVTVAADVMALQGDPVSLEEFMGIPVLEVKIGDEAFRMFFDTGAQISYFQHEALASFPGVGRLKDFYPGFGEFETDTHDVEVTLGGTVCHLGFGRLPDLVGMTLVMAGVGGIVGNEVVKNRRVGYFPRRHLLVLG